MFSTPAPSCLLHREQCSVPLCCPILPVTQRTVFSTPVDVPSCVLHIEQRSVPLCCRNLPVTQRTVFSTPVLSHLACYTENSVQYSCGCPILPVTQRTVFSTPVPFCLLHRTLFSTIAPTLPVTTLHFACYTEKSVSHLACYTQRNDTQNMKAENTRTKTDSDAGRQINSVMHSPKTVRQQADKQCKPLTKNSEADR